MADQICIYTSTGYVCYTSSGARTGTYSIDVGWHDGSASVHLDDGPADPADDGWMKIDKIRHAVAQHPAQSTKLGFDNWITAVWKRGISAAKHRESAEKPAEARAAGSRSREK